jgi:hypothetical protein
MPFCPNLNLRVSRILCGYIMLLCCSRMLKYKCNLKWHRGHLEQGIFKNSHMKTKLQLWSYLFLKTVSKKLSHPLTHPTVLCYSMYQVGKNILPSYVCGTKCKQILSRLYWHGAKKISSTHACRIFLKLAPDCLRMKLEMQLMGTLIT